MKIILNYIANLYGLKLIPKENVSLGEDEINALSLFLDRVEIFLYSQSNEIQDFVPYNIKNSIEDVIIPVPRIQITMIADVKTESRTLSLKDKNAQGFMKLHSIAMKGTKNENRN